MEDQIRYDALLTSLTAVLDFIRLTATVLLIEKTCRRSCNHEARTFIYCTLLIIAFLNEVVIQRIDQDELALDTLYQKSLLADRQNTETWKAQEYYWNLVINAVALKGALALGSFGSNYMMGSSTVDSKS